MTPSCSLLHTIPHPFTAMTEPPPGAGEDGRLPSTSPSRSRRPSSTLPLPPSSSSAASSLRPPRDHRQASASVSPPHREHRHQPPSLAQASRQASLRMSAAEHVGLDPWQKWLRFRRFPFKLVLHVLLLIAVTSHLLILNRSDAAYQRAMQRTFAFYFMPKGVDDGLGRKVIFTNQGFLACLAEATDHYFRLNELSTVSFLYRNTSSIAISSIDTDPTKIARESETSSSSGAALGLTPTPFKMRLQVAADYQPTEPLPLHYLVHHPTDLGPFALAIEKDVTIETKNDTADTSQADRGPPPPALARLLDSLLSVTLDMVLCNPLQGSRQGGRDDHCFCWRVKSRYNFRNGGNAKLFLYQYIESPCFRQASFARYLFSRLAIFNLIIFLLASTYLLLVLKSILASLSLYTRVRLAYPSSLHPLRQRYPTWANVPWRLKSKFFSTYLLLICLGTLLTLISVVVSSYHAHTYSPAVLPHKLCAGLGALFLWTGVLRFLQPYPRLYSLIPTLNAAAPRLLPFLAGFLPIFLAFALLGVSLFGRDLVLFASLPHTLKSMWSLMNGDSLHDLINASHSTRPVIANLFMFSYISLAIYVVINIIIGTTEEAFFHSRHVQRLAHRFLKRALRQLDEMEGGREDEEEEGEEEEEEGREGSVSLAAAVGRGPTARRRRREPRGEEEEEEEEEEGGKGGKKGRVRSDTLFLLHVHERQQEEVFETMLRLLVEDYRVDKGE